MFLRNGCSRGGKFGNSYVSTVACLILSNIELTRRDAPKNVSVTRIAASLIEGVLFLRGHLSHVPTAHAPCASSLSPPLSSPPHCGLMIDEPSGMTKMLTDVCRLFDAKNLFEGKQTWPQLWFSEVNSHEALFN